jgi:CDP-glycerol glycerophosphotransferase (TagB/SpsB family)
MFHAAGDVTLYRMFGMDYYDVLLTSGDYQEKQIRDLESLRNLPAKEVVKVGIPYMDEMLARFKNNPVVNKKDGEVTVLLAPSWGPSAILSKYGKKIIDVLLETGYHVIVRPHPQSFTSEKELMESLIKEYPNSEQLEWNRDADNFEVLKRSDILISDFSGVIFDFALVYDKPVIYADTSFDNSVYDAWWLDSKLWTFEILPHLGIQLNASNMGNLKELIDKCINEEKYAEGRKKAIAETWAYQGEGAKRVVDFLVKKQAELECEDKGEI